MSAMTVMPRDARDWTVADLEAVPADGLQYELLDGMLLVTPAPVVRHLLLKRSKFQDGGVTSYLIVDPEAPSVLALELLDGVYVTIGEAKGDETLELRLPFPVVLTPSALLTPSP